VLLETKAHGRYGRKIWFGNDFVPIMHDSIITGPMVSIITVQDSSNFSNSNNQVLSTLVMAKF
jgi:hypothetical protein